jgi:aspartate carbamoyltransferase catalytic subunit
VEVTADLDAAIRGADVVMALRIQKERQEAGLIPSLREYIAGYQVNARRMALASPGALLMHPGPMNEGVEVSPDVARGVNSVIEEQVTNGVAIRMAILYLLSLARRG